MSNRNNLEALIESAARLRIAEYEKRGGPSDEDLSRVTAYAAELATRGESLMFACGNDGDSAKMFNKAVEGVAILAFCLGGVTLFGTHFESQPKAKLCSNSSAITSNDADAGTR